MTIIEMTPPLQPRQKPYPRFTVGRDSHGCWVVQDRQGLVGGLFVSQAAALHFAVEESHHLPGEVICAPEAVTVDLQPMQAPAPTRRGMSRHF